MAMDMLATEYGEVEISSYECGVLKRSLEGEAFGEKRTPLASKLWEQIEKRAKEQIHMKDSIGYVGENGWQTEVYSADMFGFSTPYAYAPFLMTRDEMTDLRKLIDCALNTSADEIEALKG